MSDFNRDEFKDFIMMEGIVNESPATKAMREDVLQQIENEEADEAIYDAPEETEEVIEEDDPFSGDGWRGYEDDSFFEEAPDALQGDEEHEDDESPSFDDEEPHSGLEVDTGDTITVNGVEYPIDGLIQRFRDDEQLQAEREAINAEREQFNQWRTAHAETLPLSDLEVDKIIAGYQGFDWQWLEQNDPQGYIENKKALEEAVNKKAMLQRELIKINQEKEAEEQRKTNIANYHCVEVLKKAIPNWNHALYDDLRIFAHDVYGTDLAEINKWNKPSLWLMLYDNYKNYNPHIQPKKVIKVKQRGVKAKAKQQEVITQNKRSEMAKAWKSGKMNNHDIFRYLED